MAKSTKIALSRFGDHSAAVLYYITLFHQLNGSIKIYKKYINKYNTTQKERKEEKKQDLTLMFGYQPTYIVVRRTVLFRKIYLHEGQ